MGKAIRACIEYADDKYYKQPDGYYRTSRTRGDKSLHVQMYQDYWNCIIPKGFVVHHKDDNKENNTVANYFLLTKAGHHRWHSNRRSEETKEKLSIAGLGRITSEETKEKIRIAKLGTKHSEETKEKMRIAKSGKKRTSKYGSFTIAL